MHTPMRPLHTVDVGSTAHGSNAVADFKSRLQSGGDALDAASAFTADSVFIFGDDTHRRSDIL